MEEARNAFAWRDRLLEPASPFRARVAAVVPTAIVSKSPSGRWSLPFVGQLARERSERKPRSARKRAGLRRTAIDRVFSLAACFAAPPSTAFSEREGVYGRSCSGQRTCGGTTYGHARRCRTSVRMTALFINSRARIGSPRPYGPARHVGRDVSPRPPLCFSRNPTLRTSRRYVPTRIALVSCWSNQPETEISLRSARAAA